MSEQDDKIRSGLDVVIWVIGSVGLLWLIGSVLDWLL